MLARGRQPVATCEIAFQMSQDGVTCLGRTVSDVICAAQPAAVFHEVSP
jgi:hypothetical protein